MNRLFKTTLIVTALISSQVFAADWMSFAGNNANSSATTDYAPRDLNNSVISFTANLGIKKSSAPVVADGKLYVYANGATGTLYCLNADPQSLAIEWQAPVMVNDTAFGSWATPAAGSSSVVFAADAFLGCWNLDGTERWTITLSNKVGNGSCTIADGKIIVPCFNWANAEQSISAFDIQSGSNLWNVTDPAFASSTCTPVIDETAGKGYGCSGSLAFQFNLADGVVGWSKGLPDVAGLQNISMSGNNLFVVDFPFGSITAGSNLYSVSKSDGTLNWVAQVIVSVVPPAIEGNVLVHSSGDEWGTPQELTGIDISTGTQLWKVAKSLGSWTYMPAISKGVVYASANNSTNLTCVNVADGSIISEIALGGSSPAIANDTLYTAFNGVLYAYSWKAETMTVDKANAKILLTKDNKDGAKLSASIPMTTSPTNWINGALTLKVGGIVFLSDDTGEMKKADAKKVIWKFTSPDKTAKATIKWLAKKQTMLIKASVKKSDLRGTISYKTTDGTETSDVTSILRAGDYDFNAKSVDSMTTTAKKGKVKLKYKK